MCSRSEFEKQLDKLPICMPYEPLNQLRNMHACLHHAQQENLAIPLELSTSQALSQAMEHFPEPNLAKALRCVQTFVSHTSGEAWQTQTLQIAFLTINTHNPPAKIDHSFK